MMRWYNLVSFVALAVSLTACHGTGDGTASSPAKPLAISAEQLNAGFWQVSNLACTANDCTLKIALTPQKTCHLGDLDVIETDLSKFSTDPTVLVTLESLSNPKSVAGAHKVPLAQLKAGTAVEFKLPTSARGQWGLFLCKDSASRGRCLGKTVGRVTDLVMRDFAGAKHENGAFHSPDAVYLFQYLFIAGTSALSFRDMTTAALTPAVFEERWRFLTAQQVPPAERLGFDIAAGISRRLQSFPFDLAGGAITLPLAQESKDCQAGKQK